MKSRIFVLPVSKFRWFSMISRPVVHELPTFMYYRSRMLLVFDICRHRRLQIRKQAPQSRRRSSAQGLLCLLCAANANLLSWGHVSPLWDTTIFKLSNFYNDYCKLLKLIEYWEQNAILNIERGFFHTNLAIWQIISTFASERRELHIGAITSSSAAARYTKP